MTRHLLAGLLLLIAARAVSAQSFDCARAQSRTEKMVCADSGLRDLDEYLGRYYAAGRMAVGDAASCLQADQAQWLKATRDACQDNACLKTAYLNRLGELDPLQPGATALRNVDLPKVPSLVWIIGPAADKSAAPPKPAARPLEATGTLVDDVASGDGFMLRTNDGRQLPIVLLMFLEPPTAQRLAALAKASGATFRVRGYAARDGTRTYFEPSRCTFVHRMQ